MPRVNLLANSCWAARCSSDSPGLFADEVDDAHGLVDLDRDSRARCQELGGERGEQAEVRRRATGRQRLHWHVVVTAALLAVVINGPGSDLDQRALLAVAVHP
jgi:hypothetical protein